MKDKPVLEVKMYPHGIYISPSKVMNTGNPEPAKRKHIRIITDAVIRRISWVYMNGPWKSMLTLTYHSREPVPYKVSKKALDNVLQVLRDKGIKYMWVLEFQGRGVPHYHIWMDRRFNDCHVKDDNCGIDSWRPIMKRWLTGTKQIDDQQAKDFSYHQRCYTDWNILEYVNYAAKYASKQRQKGLPSGLDFYGKWWGVSRGLKLQNDGYSISRDEFYSNSKDIDKDMKDFNKYRRQQIRLISKVQKVRNPEKFQYGLKRIISDKTRDSSLRLLEYYIVDKTEKEVPF